MEPVPPPATIVLYGLEKVEQSAVLQQIGDFLRSQSAPSPATAPRAQHLSASDFINNIELQDDPPRLLMKFTNLKGTRNSGNSSFYIIGTNSVEQFKLENRIQLLVAFVAVATCHYGREKDFPLRGGISKIILFHKPADTQLLVFHSQITNLQSLLLMIRCEHSARAAGGAAVSAAVPRAGAHRRRRRASPPIRMRDISPAA